jgi:hypothetical protein
MESQKDVGGAPLHRVVLRRAYRLAFDYGRIPLGIGLLLGLFALMAWCLSLAWNGTNEWFGAIKDPTERGLAYIAAAIVFHAFFGKSDVDVKVDGKRP